MITGAKISALLGFVKQIPLDIDLVCRVSWFPDLKEAGMKQGVVILLLLATVVSACGNKGALYLPQSEAVEQQDARPKDAARKDSREQQ